jgi:hypothetical protein
MRSGTKNPHPAPIFQNRITDPGCIFRNPLMPKDLSGKLAVLANIPFWDFGVGILLR